MPLSSPSTSLSLIEGVRERDDPSWSRLVTIYGPIVYRWCRIRGVSASEAADITQELFIAVARNMGQYRPVGKCPFRRWLFGITSNKINDHFRKVRRQPVVVSSDLLEQTVAAVPQLNQDTEDYLDNPARVKSDRQVVMARAIEVIRNEISETRLTAYLRNVVDGIPAPQVAEELGLRADYVRQNKRRIGQRLRAVLNMLESDD